MSAAFMHDTLNVSPGDRQTLAPRLILAVKVGGVLKLPRPPFLREDSTLNAWFRLYHEFADDPKVQMMPENMQRRLVMLLCTRCKDETFQERSLAFQWRISSLELEETKALFLSQGFIDENWRVLNWDRRQYVSDLSTQRVRKHRDMKQGETFQKRYETQNETPPEQNRTDTEQIRTEESRALRTKLALSPESLAARIADRTGLLTDGARKVLIAVCRRDQHAGYDPELIVSEMSQAWEDYQRASPELAVTFGAEKFFGEGKWKDRESWGWRNNGTTKTESSLNAARAAIEEVESDRALGDVGDSTASEAGQRRLPRHGFGH